MIMLLLERMTYKREQSFHFYSHTKNEMQSLHDDIEYIDISTKVLINYYQMVFL